MLLLLTKGTKLLNWCVRWSSQAILVLLIYFRHRYINFYLFFLILNIFLQLLASSLKLFNLFTFKLHLYLRILEILMIFAKILHYWTRFFLDIPWFMWFLGWFINKFLLFLLLSNSLYDWLIILFIFSNFIQSTLVLILRYLPHIFSCIYSIDTPIILETIFKDLPIFGQYFSSID